MTTSTSNEMTQTSKYSTLLPPNWRTKVTEWLQEDIPSFDYGIIYICKCAWVYKMLVGKTSNTQHK